MRTWAKGTARAALLTAGFVALGSGSVFSGTAFADTSGDGSLLGGNQINLPISVPIEASGNAIAVGGRSTAGSQGGASVDVKGGGAGQRTSGKRSVLGGNQVNAPVSVPVNVCGNAVAVLGNAGAFCDGGASVDIKGGPAGKHPAGHGGHGGHGHGGHGGHGGLPGDVCGPWGGGHGHQCGHDGLPGGYDVPPATGGDCPWPGGHGDGGDDGYGADGYDHERSGVPRRSSLPDLPALPVGDDLTERPGITAGSALPTLPDLPAAAPDMTGSAAQPVRRGSRTVQVPETARMAGGLRTLPMGSPAGLLAMPAPCRSMPTGLASKLPGGPAKKIETARTTGERPESAQAEIPAGADAVTGNTGSLTGEAGELTGKAGAVTGAAGTVADDGGAVKPPVTDLAPMASTGRIAGHPETGSLPLVLLGGLLAGASLITAFARRVRPGRR